MLPLRCSPASLAQRLTYRFTTLAVSAQGFDPFEFGCAAINNQSEVAFRAARADTFVQGIFRANKDGRLVTIVEETNDEYNFLGFNPSLNDQGEVSFTASLDSDGEASCVAKAGG